MDVQSKSEQFARSQSPEYLLAQDFVRQVSELAWVKRVILLEAPEHQVHIVIDAPEFDFKYRGPIYDIELNVLDQSPPGTELEFFLTNCREHTSKTVRPLVPGEIVLLER